MYFVQDSHSFWNWIYFVVLIVVSLVLSALSWYLRSYQYHFKRFCVKALTWQEPCCVITRIVITRTYKRWSFFFNLERGEERDKEKSLYDVIDVNVFHRNLKRFHCTKGGWNIPTIILWWDLSGYISYVFQCMVSYWCYHFWVCYLIDGFILPCELVLSGNHNAIPRNKGTWDRANGA